MSTTVALYIVLAVCIVFFLLCRSLMRTINEKNKEIATLKHEVSRLKVFYNDRSNEQ